MSVGHTPIAVKPITLITGKIANVTPTPSHLMMRPVRKICAITVSSCTVKSIRARKAVCALRSWNSAFTITACWKYSSVVPIVNSSMNRQIIIRYGDPITCVMPEKLPPPIDSPASSRLRDSDRKLTGKRRTHCTATSSMTAESSTSGAMPSFFAKSAVMADPANAPTVPPTLIKPYSRFPCSLRKLSDMKPQNTDTTNKLKTLVQMKKTGASHLSLLGHHVIDAKKNSRQAPKQRYTIGMNRRTGMRATSDADNGCNASVDSRVPVNRYGSVPTPACTPSASRILRRMK